MTTKSPRLLFATILAGTIFAAPVAHAQDSGDRTIEQYMCKDLMRDGGPDRDVAIAFLHGYLVGKSGSSKFNVDLLRKQSNLFIDRCLENPNAKAVDIMLQVKK